MVLPRSTPFSGLSAKSSSSPHPRRGESPLVTGSRAVLAVRSPGLQYSAESRCGGGTGLPALRRQSARRPPLSVTSRGFKFRVPQCNAPKRLSKLTASTLPAARVSTLDSGPAQEHLGLLILLGTETLPPAS